MNQQQQRMLIMVLAGIFGLLVLIGIGWAIWQSQKGKVITTLVPNDATVMLDGRKVNGDATHFVDPGSHEFMVTRAAFSEKKFAFDIKAGETKSIALFALPDENAGLEWVKQNPDEASELDGMVSREYIEKSERVYAENQILSNLPIVDTGFRIEHGMSQKGNDFALYIQSSDEAGRVAALETLKYLGYNPDSFEIIYVTPE